jgi:predicted nucleic acid-binding protein
MERKTRVILIDTSVLLAAVFSKDVNHTQARQFLRTIGRGQGIVPAPVVSELFFMVAKRVTYQRAVEAFALVRATYAVVPLEEDDMAFMESIMRTYTGAEFDYADLSIMALANRLNISRIATFDRRDFSIYRPQHTPYLELLP